MKGLEEFLDFIGQRVNKGKEFINKVDQQVKEEMENLSPRETTIPPASPREGWLTKTDLINRVEVIDEKGRSYVNWKTGNKVHVSFQDQGRTLKIFINTIK